MVKIRTRFAPSPTGQLHIGSLRTALYSYALAKHSQGDFILRIEDTDQKREVEGATEKLKSILKDFSLDWNEYYVQSERKKEGLYQKAAEKLIEDEHAFYCQCDAKNAKDEGYSKELRDPCRDKNLASGAVKLKVKEGETVSYFDLVHQKEISWQTDTVYDATLLKSDGFPTYHLAVVVDDTDMNISHVLRGHDWLPSTPIHLLVYKYLGYEPPMIGHLTDILSAETGKKLSKRRDSVFVEQYLKEGYLKEAILNYVMLLGWAPKDDRELFSLEEFVKVFDVDGFQQANPKFSKDKLDWFNSQYIQKKDRNEFVTYISDASVHRNEPQFQEVGPGTATFMPSRMNNIADYDNMTKFFYYNPEVDTKMFGDDYEDHIRSSIEVLGRINDWNLKNINDDLMKMIEEKGYKVGKFFMSLRIAITGSKFTPPINESIELLGKDETLKRLGKLV